MYIDLTGHEAFNTNGKSEQMNKQQKAIEILKNNSDKTRKDVIALIVSELGMTDAGASTYYYNAKNAISKGTTDSDAGAKTATVDPIKAAADAAKAKKSAPKAQAEAPKAESEPGGGVGTEKEKVEELTGSDAWMKRNAALRADIDNMLAQIDVSQIPAFLRK